MKQETTRELAGLLNEPMFNVEVTSNTSTFPFNLFRKKPYDQSSNYPADPKNPNHSYADFGFNRKIGAMRFAVRARGKGLGARVFEFNCHFEIDCKLVDG